MHRLLILAALVLAFYPVTLTFAKADNVIEEKVPNAEIVGKGRFTYMLWDLYDASLHAPKGTWQQTQPYALRLEYLRNLSGNKIANKSAEEIRKQGFNDEARLAAWYGQMKKIFPNVSKGTEIIGIHIPGEETRFYSGTTEIGSIKDPEFGKWFFGIWLSEKTSAPKLRTSLLGQR